jgi:D-aspartate ligase
VLDRTVPALIFRIGRYPFAHGSLAAIRTLGRAGVAVYSSVEDRFVPHYASRYLNHGALLATTAVEDREDVILARLQCFGRLLGRPAVLLATDDEAALFSAEHAASLRPSFILPEVDGGLPRKLASKQGLYQSCLTHQVPTPQTAYARTVEDVHRLLDSLRFPVIVKNSEPWLRITSPAVSSTTIVNNRDELAAMAAGWVNDPNIIVQEYIPSESAQDWMVHVYCGRTEGSSVAYTGRKLRQWPHQAGVTTCGVAVRNDRLREMAARYCQAMCYHGIADMDWRYDQRDDQYKLVDFNPRIGSNFRLLVDDAGLDVVRRAHMDMSGRTAPAGVQTFGRGFTVENLDLAARLLQRKAARQTHAIVTTQTERAWFASDDPLPFVVMALRFATTVVAPRILSTVISAIKHVSGYQAKNSHTARAVDQ